ncbi:hypothetical protein GCM10019071_01950 [Sphingobium fuliginis]|uniref:Uncharacterized protein n=1 Tax=Sphingobium fuliginis (strain ATCC 27551) TaxID=336203 RepID=A0ABQ1ELZ1_SPHSA|nr:hypothetical protein GCM10019071_01950 [Sphingobium fuliginis]
MAADRPFIIDAVEKGWNDGHRQAQGHNQKQQRNAQAFDDFPDDAAHAVSRSDDRTDIARFKVSASVEMEQGARVESGR